MKLKLAMVSPFPEKPGVVTGGVEGVADYLTYGLRQIADIDLHIVASCGENKPGIEERDGMTIHWLKYPRFPRCLTYWNIYRNNVHRCLKKIAPHITHFQCTAGFVTGYTEPNVLTIHGINEKDVLYTNGPFVNLRSKLLAWVENKGRQSSDNLILISPYILDEIGEQLHGNQWHIENPIHTDMFDVKRNSTDQVILYVGRICRRKNVYGLIRAFEMVHNVIPNATLRIAGLPESEDYLLQCKNYIKEANLDSTVQFLGNLDRVSLLGELSRASCLALVSYQETAPLVIEEAMAAGVPVIASRVCGMPFMVDDGKTGFLVDPDNHQEISKKMLCVLQNDELNKQMSELSRDVARARFHIEPVARKTLDVYLAVLNQAKHFKIL